MPTTLSIPSTRSILSAIFAITAARILRRLYRNFRIPRSLRHIPHVSLFGGIKGILTQRGFDDRYEKDIKPLLRESKEKMVLTYDRFAWELHVADPVLAKAIAAGVDDYWKENLMEYLPGGLATTFWGNNILFVNGETWKLYRRVVAEGFKRNWEPEIFAHPTELMFDHWKPMIQRGEAIDVDFWLKKVTMEALGRGVLNVEFGALAKDPSTFFWEPNFKSVLHGIVFEPIWFLLSSMDRPWNPMRRGYFKKAYAFREKVQHLIDTRRKQVLNGEVEDGKKDLITLMVEATLESVGDERKIQDYELVNNLILLMLAGHDTTATAIGASLYYMARHPDVQEKAREEVLSVLNGSSYPSVQHQKQLTYLNAVIREAQRLCPSSATLMERLATHDVILPNGTLVPKGTYVNVNIWAMQRDPELWGPDAEEFRPERFLGSDATKRITTYDYMVFNHGPRVCLGMQFALNELRVVLSMILLNYRWSLPDDSIHHDRLHISHSYMVGIKNLKLDMEPI